MLSIFDIRGNKINEVVYKQGDNLFALLVDAGYNMTGSCGGKGTCNKCLVTVDGKEIKSCQFTLEKDHDIILADHIITQGKAFVLTSDDLFEDIDDNHKNVGVALDIGTTTIAAYFYDLDTKKLIFVDSALNPQAKYGADVISRIDYTIKNEKGTKLMQNLILSSLRKLFSNFNNIERAVIAGNTTMLHFLMGEESASLARAPYTPIFLDYKVLENDELGLGIKKVILTPSISAFIGGDIVAGVLASEIYKGDKTILLIDMGTNGEMVLRHKGSLIAASTACGPAFEGANISHGMGGVSGAISRVWIGDSKKIEYEVLGNEAARGICGSGLIDLIAVLVRLGLIDETGFMEEDFEVSKGIFLTTRDVREFQNAKAAIGAGIKTIAKEAKLDLHNIDRIYLAGGFGSYIDIDSAIEATLLPYEFKGKSIAIGNSSGRGASQLLLDESLLEIMERISKETNYVELAENGYFSDFYVDSMLFE